MRDNWAVMITAGGRGRRLWPLSRRGRPKQFLPLVTRRTLLEDTYRRLATFARPARSYVVAEEELLAGARNLLPGIPPENFLAEPAARGTWPCCVWGTLVVASRLGADTVLCVLAADETVADDAAFRETLAAGASRAARGALVVFGVPPNRAETGYGYLRCGETLAPGPPRVRRGLSFTEKPDEAGARLFWASGEYLWNTGAFAWRADRFLEICARHRAREYDAVCAIRGALAAGDGKTAAAFYGRLEATSVDYALFERLPSFEIVELDCGWDDIGTFDSLARVLRADEAGNVGWGELVVLDAKDNVGVAAAGRSLVLVDVEGLVVVDAGDVVLVYPRGRSQKVRRAVELMEKTNPTLL